MRRLIRIVLAAAVCAAGLTLCLEPAARSADAVAGRWAFDPRPDDFRPDALLDLRSLNEASAGEHGFVRVSPDGDFLDGRGQPLRFWAVNTGVQDPLPQYSQFPPRDLARHARWLAKRGVNMVRWHGVQYPLAGKGGPTDDPTAVNRTALDGLWRLVAAMKNEGIYTTISPYWANALRIPAAWGIEGPDKQDAHAILFFHPKLRAAYKAWLRVLFTEKNPYTGVPLAREPAVALIQLQNEDSLLFWTFSNLGKEQQAVLGKQFGDWLARKYGSPAQAGSAWGGAAVTATGKLIADDPARGVFGFYHLYDFTTRAPKPPAGKARRMADQLEFLTETMRAFNQDIVNYLRNDLGCRQLVNCGNWRTADPTLLEDAERYSYTPGEVIAVNRYFAAPHLGPRNGWAEQAGDRYANASVLEEPRELPVGLKQVRGKPMVLSESSWVTPNNCQSEGAFLVAAYQSLNGVDTFYWFATGTTEWTPPMSANGFARDTLGKWVIATPDQLGQFPAAAWLFRRGLVRRGEPVVVEHRPPADLWARKPPVIAEDPGFDPNRDAGDTAARAGRTAVDPLSFLAGPVEVVYGGDAADTRVADLSKLIDRSAKVVRSVTGELALDYGRRVATLAAPQAQGVCGFLKGAGGRFDLGAVTVESGNDYAAVLAVSLDGRPLAESGKVLIQVGTRSRPTGWQDRPETLEVKGQPPAPGLEILNIGTAPWMVENTEGAVAVKNSTLTRATLLDANFNAAADVPVRRDGGALRLTLPPHAMYVVLQ
jgi:hypothetical protein